MSKSSLHQLKVKFRDLFPEEAKALERAKNQNEINALHAKFIQKAKQNVEDALRIKETYTVAPLDHTDQTASLALTNKQYNNLIEATGDDIENQLHVIVDGLTRLKGMQNDEAAVVTAQILGSGVLAIGGIAWAAANSSLAAGAVEATAALAGVTAVTVVGAIAIVTLVIILILIPIIYFMQKPANCIVLLINELDEELTWSGDYNAHGKPQLLTTPIPKAVFFPSINESIVNAGFIATEKKEDALIGTQYGFTMQYKDIDLSFGVECPLTGIYSDNNCYCGIGISAEKAAEETDNKNVQYYTDTQNDVTISIRCNSGSGSIAYYVARAYSSS